MRKVCLKRGKEKNGRTDHFYNHPADHAREHQVLTSVISEPSFLVGLKKGSQQVRTAPRVSGLL